MFASVKLFHNIRLFYEAGKMSEKKAPMKKKKKAFHLLANVLLQSVYETFIGITSLNRLNGKG